MLIRHTVINQEIGAQAGSKSADRNGQAGLLPGLPVSGALTRLTIIGRPAGQPKATAFTVIND